MFNVRQLNREPVQMDMYQMFAKHRPCMLAALPRI